MLSILNLVLYSDSIVYNDMYIITNNHYKKYKNVDTIYYTFSDKIEEQYYHDTDKNILYIKGEESYIPGVLQKTIKAFQYVLYLNLNKDYDYIVRTNISTIVNFDKLNKKLIENSFDYGGLLYNCIQIKYRDENCGIIDDRYKGLKYASGTCIICSKKLLEHIIKNDHLIDYSVMDDISIGDFVRKYEKIFKIKLYNEKFIFTTLDNFKNINVQDYILFRNKTNDRNKDIEIMDYIVKKLSYLS